jgi:adenine-specific DNA-methyltransferase
VKAPKMAESLFPTESAGLTVGRVYDSDVAVTLYPGDCLDLLATLPGESADLVVTSPPYNIGKEYEKRLDVSLYLEQHAAVIGECIRVLTQRGSLCWQVGSFVADGAIVPLDAVLYPLFAQAGLKMRTRIVWHFEHGLHCSRRFSGRYEVIMWFTKTDHYVFNLDAVRVPQKYPGKKHFKGARVGQYSCNPLGKNPGDVWEIPNVKHNHVEKTAHPCQFPVELVERLVLSMTETGSLVVDPFMGVGTTAVAAVRHGRKAAGAEIVPKYLEIALQRVRLEMQGMLPTRPMRRPVFQPRVHPRVSRSPSREVGTDGGIL